MFTIYQVLDTPAVKPSLVVLAEPQSYQLLIVGLVCLGLTMLWQNIS